MATRGFWDIDSGKGVTSGFLIAGFNSGFALWVSRLGRAAKA
jgi:hypothetical protein